MTNKEQQAFSYLIAVAEYACNAFPGYEIAYLASEALSKVEQMKEKI